jgi:hypothetical protein
MNPEIEEFAKVLVRHVRDAAIQASDQVLSAKAQHATAKRWAKAARELPPTDFARVLIPDIVDTTIFYLLDAIDQEVLKLNYTANHGKVVDLAQQGRGELAGWFVGDESWRDRYSQERFVDDSGPAE